MHKHARDGWHDAGKMAVKKTKQKNGNEFGETAWKMAKEQEAAAAEDARWRGRGVLLRHSYLALAIVPPGPLVTQTNKTARTYHGSAVSDLGLDTAIFFKLYEVVEGVPRPCAAERDGGTEFKRGFWETNTLLRLERMQRQRHDLRCLHTGTKSTRQTIRLTLKTIEVYGVVHTRSE